MMELGYGKAEDQSRQQIMKERFKRQEVRHKAEVKEARYLGFATGLITMGVIVLIVVGTMMGIAA